MIQIISMHIQENEIVALLKKAHRCIWKEQQLICLIKRKPLQQAPVAEWLYSKMYEYVFMCICTGCIHDFQQKDKFTWNKFMLI